MEELIARINEQYTNEEYAGMLETVTAMNEHCTGLNNVIASLESERAEQSAEIEKIRKENAELKAANATLFLKANGSDLADVSEKCDEKATDDYESWIDPADFK